MKSGARLARPLLEQFQGLDIFCQAIRAMIQLGFCPTVMPMLKGIFWSIVLLALIGFHMHILALFLFMGIVGVVAKMFFAPFRPNGSS